MRINYATTSPDGLRAVYGLSNYAARHTDLEESLLHFIELRASQINGCAFCAHLHSLQLRELGMPDLKIDTVGMWEETDHFTDREKAALAWTEAVTLVSETHVPDDVYERARSQFNEKQLVDLTLAIGVINVWNRLAISMRQDPAEAPKLLESRLNAK